jgi:putative inorganic carbon (hco3(-)) transporter
LKKQMVKHRAHHDYEPVLRSGRRRVRPDAHAIAQDWPAKAESLSKADSDQPNTNITSPGQGAEFLDANRTSPLRRGHLFSYTALFLFTVILYLRPSELYPSRLTASLALMAGLLTLAFYIPSQLSLEGSLTARPPEVNLVLLFALTGVLSIPLAISPYEAWHEFSDAFIRCIVIFIVMVNVVRTETRLKGLLFLTLAVGVWLSMGAVNDYRLGLLTVEGYRAGGRGGGIFGNSNDMALFLVTTLPVAIAFLVSSRNLVLKAIFGSCGVVMIVGIVLTYSRGGFIGLLVVFAFLGWRIGHRHRIELFISGAVVTTAILALAPGYALRLASIIVPSLDPLGSSDARRGELLRSMYIALRHPLLGIGMGNYAPEMSYHGLVTHNSYTQVAAEMGLAALVCYTTFIVSPLKKLGQIARETFEMRRNSRFYYLAVGLQASLLGYMVCSFFASVAYLWYVFYLVGYAVCLRRLYESETGRVVIVEKQKRQKSDSEEGWQKLDRQHKAVTT